MSKKDKDQKPKIHNADDLIIRMEAQKLGNELPEIKPKEEMKLEKEEPSIEEESPPKTEEIVKEEESKEEKEAKEDKEEENKTNDAPEDHEIDEYGSKIKKSKMYTEEEVQSMIRKRLRDRHIEAPAEVQEAVKEFTPDSESNESWEHQLESFIDQTISKRETKLRETEWRQNEGRAQAEFEVKFTEGMSKYDDFSEVVSDVPITNAMMLAARSMKDPAAFIYAAAKQNSKELARISQIPDAVTQATEIGRLEERMKKHKVIPSSPRPSQKIKGDASHEMPQVDIDSRIAQHAKSKIMNFRK